MNKRLRQVSYFLSGQYFSGGLRITVSILLPALLLAQFHDLPTGMALSIGAMSVSLSDVPGPLQHRRNGMLATIGAGLLLTILTGFARMNDYVLGLTIAVVSFFFSMFTLYGPRATSVGTAAMLVMVLMIDRPLDAAGVLREGVLVMAGGLWYLSVSLLTSRLRPYRPARQALSHCIHEVARFMAIKADFYRTSTRLDDDYRRLLAQQVVVSEKQDAVRELLFRQYLAESDATSRRLVLMFSDVLDLYEQVLAMYYDYSDIRERFAHTPVLNHIAAAIEQLSDELDHLGLAVQTSAVPVRPPADLSALLVGLKQEIDQLGEGDTSTFVLRKVLVSIRTVNQRLLRLQATLTAPIENLGTTSLLDYTRFVSHQDISLDSFRDNLTLDSSSFRYSLRVAVAMLLGFVVAKLLPSAHHSYWVLLTVMVILKPAFSLTKQRNRERIVGTLLGGAVGVLVLTLVPDKTVQFALMVLFMLGTYSALRVNYIVMVVCVTPFVIILSNFLGMGYLAVTEERFLDTVIGGSIALTAGYLLFPRWESEQLRNYMRDVLRANLRYVQLLLDRLVHQPVPVQTYKLARREVYVTSANVAAAFERMTSEPKHTQRHEKNTYEFVVLNHVLSANVATILSGLLSAPPRPYPASALRPVRRAVMLLSEALHHLGQSSEKPALPDLPVSPDTAPPATPDEQLLLEQLTFIQQVCGDINRISEKLV